jgi:predicted transcriptional regulator
MTVLDNLHRKGWVQRVLSGRAYRYWPLAEGGPARGGRTRLARGACLQRRSGRGIAAFCEIGFGT